MKLCVHQHVPAWRRRTRLSRPPSPERRVERASWVEIPANLRTWFCDATLVTWIRQEIQDLNWSHPRVCDYLQQHPNDNPEAMLAVLALALASAIYGGEEIAWACRSDPVFHNLCQGQAPFPHELGSFRRQNRRVLEKILTGVLTRAVGARLGLCGDKLPAALQRCLRANAVERLDLARHADLG